MHKIEAKNHKLLKAYTSKRMPYIYVTEAGDALACNDGKAIVSVELTPDIEPGWYWLSTGSIIEKIDEESVNKFPTDFFEEHEESFKYILPSCNYIEAVAAAIRALDDKTTINPDLLKPFYDYVGEASLFKNDIPLILAEVPGCKLIFATTKL